MTSSPSYLVLLATIALANCPATASWASSRLLGAVTDAEDRALTNAFVELLRTPFATTTDQSGRYIFNRLPAGTYTAQVSHLGYKATTATVILPEGQSSVVDFVLPEDFYVLDEVVVIGKLISAQAQALNAQKEAPNIKNVVSHQLFSRFPDFNAAETLQRLPGVTIDRDQGEGEFVHVRGLNAQLNSTTVNGKRIPSPTSSLEEGRAVGLDLIQSNNADFVEVIKAPTPDMDADALGGAINLDLKRPPEKPQYAFSLAGGWNDKAARFSRWGDETVDLNGMAGRRFAAGKLGLVTAGNLYRTNRGALLNEIAYAAANSDAVDYHRWDNYDVLRHRLGLLLGADYRFSEIHDLRFNLTWNRFLDDEIRRRREFIPAKSLETQETRNRREDQRFTLVDLAGTRRFRQWKLDYSTSMAEASEELPDRTYFLFARANPYLDAGGRGLNNDRLLELDLETSFAGLGPFALYRNQFDNEKTTERDWAGAFDAEYFFDFRAKQSTAKAGFKVLHKKRQAHDRRWEYLLGRANITAEEDEFGFLDVKYEDPEATALFPLSSYQEVPQFFNYEAQETIYATYAMATLNWSPRLSALLGARTEITTHSYAHQLSVAKSDEAYFNVLPSLHLTYHFDDRTNLRLALTSGLARPEYSRLLPVSVPVEGELLKGNPDLVATKSFGADLMLETYPRPLGLISVGCFAKRLLDPIAVRVFPQELLGQTFKTLEPVNGDAGYALGLELSLMQQLSMLDIPLLRYCGLYSNYTYAFSQVDYGDLRTADGPMAGSARHAANMGVFYDNALAGTSFTVSATYRAPLLKELESDPRSDVWFAEELHLDLSASRRLTSGLSLFIKLNNLSNESRREIYGDPYIRETYLTRFHQREAYGRSGVMGISYHL